MPLLVIFYDVSEQCSGARRSEFTEDQHGLHSEISPIRFVDDTRDKVDAAAIAQSCSGSGELQRDAPIALCPGEVKEPCLVSFGTSDVWQGLRRRVSINIILRLQAGNGIPDLPTHVVKRSEPREHPSADGCPALESIPDRAATPAPLDGRAMKATRSLSRSPTSQRRSGLAGASLIRTFRADLARTSNRTPVLTQRRSGRRKRFTLVIQILFEVQ